MYEHDKAKVDAAVASYQNGLVTGLAKLKRSDGRPLYSEVEREERAANLRADLLNQFDATIAPIRTSYENQRAEAERALATLEAPDPFASLATDELEKANLRRAFVEEDARLLSVGEIAGRIRSAVAKQDKVESLLWWRYASIRTATDIENGRDILGARQLRDLINAELDPLVTDPNAATKRTNARNALKGARDFESYVMKQRWAIDGTIEATMEQARQRAGAAF